VSNLLVVLNSSLNFVIYFRFSRPFRDELERRCHWFVRKTAGVGQTIIVATTATTATQLPNNNNAKSTCCRLLLINEKEEEEAGGDERLLLGNGRPSTALIKCASFKYFLN
jgi:hypothetical protein